MSSTLFDWSNLFDWRYSAATGLIWRLVMCVVNMAGYYMITTIKSNHLKTLFAKMGVDTDNIDEKQLKLFKFTSAIRVLKQNLWALTILNYGMPPYFLIFWPLYESLFDVLNIWIYAKYGFKNRRGRAANKWMNVVGLVLFAFGAVMESGHDYLLKTFKLELANKGNIYVAGFAQYIAYPNYSGYILWRTGQSFLANNMVYASMMTAFLYSQFIYISIPEKDHYLCAKYGKVYQDYIAKTHRLIPFVY